ncbi:phosphoketolase family protein [Spirosoma foliorum]|uniref:Phosphoketolase family protein n=1 Tax=Spirosoma foliorum TaxID=2710596 RepID=A0A7G5GQ74_9BACT|nr:phosphoketolase family protein [Spirosoma foliorum]QMW01016.1 phosphoketolase family protein [Spirosoma foliorum]
MNPVVDFSIPEPTYQRLANVHRYWLATNYLGAAQLYLRDNFLLERPLKSTDIKPRLLGHWGTQPGLNLLYAHLNRLIQDTDASILLVTGPGHGAPAILANLYLEGTLGEYDPTYQVGLNGMSQLIRQFSWPYGLPSHLVPGTPGQIQEGGELGYCLSHAFGAALDNPDLIVACVVGDGEAETGPLAASWHSNKYLNPATSGAVLPILHANGYKLSGPTIYGRMSHEELTNLFTGYGYQVRIIGGSDPMQVHAAMWQAMNWAYGEIRTIQQNARAGLLMGVPAWPMLILQTPKGWTCPLTVDGQPIENTSHAHQLPVADPAGKPSQLATLESWLRSYRPQDLFDGMGQPFSSVTSNCPMGSRRIGMNAHANGGQLLVPLELPNYFDYAVKVPSPGTVSVEGTHQLAIYLRDVFCLNESAQNFRIVCPDETTSNRMTPLFQATQRAWMGPMVETDEFLSPDGQVMEILSEHTCEGWLEGYLLTGRHGLFGCYEAFIPLVDSMLNQYAKWLKVSKETSWRKPLASLNYLLTSHVWRQDHNGYTHQVPSFINSVVAKKSSVARVYLPPDANCLLAVTDHCLRSRDYINLIVASKACQAQWLSIDAARDHCSRGLSVWDWAGNAGDQQPDVVLACAGDVPTNETIAAAAILKERLPDLRVRVLNIVDLLTIMSPEDHPHGFPEAAFSQLFTTDRPVIFAFHGYPMLIHELLHHRTNPNRFHVRGYMEEGRTTTPFDMLVLNNMSRYQLVMAALQHTNNLPGTQALVQWCQDKLTQHAAYIRREGLDMPEVRS